jgi:hypothetical protein
LFYASDRTGAPIAVRNRALGSIDAYAATVGRWLVTRDGFDLLVYYLPDYDYASHLVGPDAAYAALARSDDAIGALMDAAGGPDEFLDRYAVILCSDHGQSRVENVARLQVGEDLVTESNRAAMVYTESPRAVAESLDAEPAAGIVVFREDGRVVARRDGDEDDALLDAVPDGRARAAAALANPNAGEVLVSASPGWEFLDLAGRHHLGGGSHGSLEVGDSEVPMLTVGLGDPPASITRVKEAITEHFAVSAPAEAERTATP